MDEFNLIAALLALNVHHFSKFLSEERCNEIEVVFGVLCTETKTPISPLHW